ncbi:MAG: heavy-metal-associated domain-containing protein [Chitinophagales bacterium]
MEKEYTVKGMHCNNCKTRVEKMLSTVVGVQSVSIDLQKEKAMIVSNEAITIEQLQNALPESFQLS